MGDDLMQKILLELQNDMQAVIVGQTEMKAEIHEIKKELDQLKADDEGRDLLGVIRIIQNYPKVSSILAIVFVVGLTMTGSVILSTYKLDQLVEKAASPYFSGPPAPSTLVAPVEPVR